MVKLFGKSLNEVDYSVVIRDELVELLKLSLVLGERVENALGGFASYVWGKRDTHLFNGLFIKKM